MNINPVLDSINKNRGLGSSNSCYDVMYFVARLLNCRIILEIGTHQGASAITFCQAILDNGLAPKIYTVDNWSKEDTKNIALANFTSAGMMKYIELKEGGSAEIVPQIVSSIHSFDLVFIDGGHTAEMVSKDYKNIKGCTKNVLFHDTRNGDQECIKRAKEDGFDICHFNTKYIEGDRHLVGITLCRK